MDVSAETLVRGTVAGTPARTGAVDRFGAVALAQGGYYVATGLWPLVHMRSFEAVTGPKQDDWLVKTVALLLVVGGASIAAGSRRASAETAVLAMGSAIALGAVDVVYAARRRISPIYLLDAVVEAGLLAGFASGLRRRGQG